MKVRNKKKFDKMLKNLNECRIVVYVIIWICTIHIVVIYKTDNYNRILFVPSVFTSIQILTVVYDSINEMLNKFSLLQLIISLFGFVFYFIFLKILFEEHMMYFMLIIELISLIIYFTRLKYKKDYKKITVCCFEGEPGVGKTTILGDFDGKVLNEKFMNFHNFYLFEQQSLISQVYWMIHWFKELEKELLNYYDNDTELFKGDYIIYSDRSPYSSVVFTRKSNILSRITLFVLIKFIIKMWEYKSVYIKTVHITDKYENIKKRRLNRLNKEPSRKEYGEDDEYMMIKIRFIYNIIKWDITIDLNKINVKEIKQHIKSNIKQIC